MLKGDPFIFLASQHPALPKENHISIYAHQAALLLYIMPRWPVRVLIGDEVGLGKTIEAISILRYLEARGKIKRALIVVPRILLKQWEFELMRMGVPAGAIKRLEKEDVLKMKEENLGSGYFLTSIDLLKRDDRLPRFLDIKWDVLVVDEAHNATPGTKRGKAVRRLIEKKKISHVIFLSATPHRGDAYGYLWRLGCIDPALGEFLRDRKNLKYVDDRSFYRTTHDVIVIRRNKGVVNEVEGREVFRKCEFNTVLVEPTPAEYKFMDKLITFLREILERSDNKAIELLAAIMRKRAGSSPHAALKTFQSILNGIASRQKMINFSEINLEEVVLREISPQELSTMEETLLSDAYTSMEEIEEGKDLDDVLQDTVSKLSGVLTPVDSERIRELLKLAVEIKRKDSKLEAVKNIVRNTIARGDKLVIFTEYQDTLDYIYPEIERVVGAGRVVHLSGRNKKDFDRIREKFEKDPTVRVLIATDVAAEGLNLQVANVVINYEPPWSPIKIEQRIGRVWRIGQKKDVRVYTVFIATDADRDVVDNLYRKIINMHAALEDTAPILGQKAQVYRKVATPSEGLWDANFEVLEVEMDGKRKKINDHTLSIANIRGNLSEFAAAIIQTLRTLNMELAQNEIYPHIKGDTIRNMLQLASRTVRIDDYIPPLRNLVRVVAQKRSSTPPMGLEKWDAGRLLKYIDDIQDIPQPEDAIILWSKTPGLIGERYVLSVGNAYWRTLAIYDPDTKEILLGAGALEYISKIFVGEVIAPETTTESFKIDMIARTKAKEAIKDIISKVHDKCYHYDRKVRELGLRDTPLFDFGGDVQVEMIGKIIHPEGDLPTPPTEEIKDAVEEAAMQIAMEYERQKGNEVRDVHMSEHYDLESYSPGGTVTYIEVKGHIGHVIEAELTEAEFQTAQKLGKSYSIYIVYNLKRDVYNRIIKHDAKIAVFPDPLNTMSYYVKGERRYIFRPK